MLSLSPSQPFNFSTFQLFSWLKCLTFGVQPFASSSDIMAKHITMSRSPTFPLCAAAPFRQQTWLPRLPAMAYVSKRFPFSTSATSIFSYVVGVKRKRALVIEARLGYAYPMQLRL